MKAVSEQENLPASSDGECNRDGKPSLLQQLRSQEVPSLTSASLDSPRKAEEMQRLIVRHRSEFPSHLQDRIPETNTSLEFATREAVRRFLAELSESIRAFCFGHCLELEDGEDPSTNTVPPQRWHDALDSAIHTQDELELVLRLLPSLLTKPDFYKRGPNVHRSFLVYRMLASPMTLSFVPLLLELADELVVTNRSNSPIRCVAEHWTRNVSLELVRTCPVYQHPAWDSDARSVLQELRARGLLTPSDVVRHDLVWPLLLEPIACVQERLGFLLEWDPSVVGPKGSRLLLRFLLRQVPSCVEAGGDSDEDAKETFRQLLETSMLRCPLEIGFLFHKEDYANDIEGTTHSLSFRLACKWLGRETVATLIDAAISKQQQQQRTTASANTTSAKYATTPAVSVAPIALVLAAATNNDILLDGLYTIIRRDPISAFLP